MVHSCLTLLTYHLTCSFSFSLLCRSLFGIFSVDGAEVEPTEDFWSATGRLSGLLGASDSPLPEWLATHHISSASETVGRQLHTPKLWAGLLSANVAEEILLTVRRA